MSETIHSDSTWRDELIEAAARLFFVSAYADFVEEPERYPDGYDYPRPGGGDDWMEYAPERTPINAYVLAGEMWASIEAASKINMYALGARANQADGGEYACDVDAEDFGTGLAWMYMGAGPSWFDDHATFEIEVPSAEIHGMTFDPACYRENE